MKIEGSLEVGYSDKAIKIKIETCPYHSICLRIFRYSDKAIKIKIETDKDIPAAEV